MKLSFPKEKIKIVLFERIHDNAVNTFKKAGYPNVELLDRAYSEEELIEKLKDVRIIGVRSKTQITKRVLENAPKLLGVGCFCIGTNQVDLECATEKGVVVFNSPYSNTRSVNYSIILFVSYYLNSIILKVLYYLKRIICRAVIYNYFLG